MRIIRPDKLTDSYFAARTSSCLARMICPWKPGLYCISQSNTHQGAAVRNRNIKFGAVGEMDLVLVNFGI